MVAPPPFSGGGWEGIARASAKPHFANKKIPRNLYRHHTN
jgi:hypothetical protein